MKETPISGNRNGNSKSCTQCRQFRSCIVAQLSTPKGLEHLPGVSRHDAIYVRKQLIFGQNSRFSSCYVVKSGSVKTVNVDSKGNEKVVGFYLPGDVFGWEGIHSEHLPCGAIAMERSTVCKIALNDLEQLASSRPESLHVLLKLISRELNTAEALAIGLTRYTAKERIVRFLLEISQRFEERHLSALSFRLPMNRTDMANYLGLAVETVSRILGKMQQQGDIVIRGKEVRLLNPERLYNLFNHPDDPIVHTPERNDINAYTMIPKRDRQPFLSRLQGATAHDAQGGFRFG